MPTLIVPRTGGPGEKGETSCFWRGKTVLKSLSAQDELRRAVRDRRLGGPPARPTGSRRVPAHVRDDIDRQADDLQS